MAVSPIDPGFNGGQPVYSADPFAISTGTSQNSASAVAVQQDGKIVVVGTHATSPFRAVFGTTLAVRRFNADGSVDATFGISGEEDVPIAIPSGDLVSASSNVLIQQDGKIVLAADLAKPIGNPAVPSYTADGTLVVRLNTDGTLDKSFGTNGVTSIATDAAHLTNLALQSDNKIVLAGLAVPTGAARYSYAATRLNMDGTVDATFNGGKLLVLDATTFGTAAGSGLAGTPPLADSLAGVFAVPGGSIVLALQGGVAELNVDGTVATSFGTTGTGFVANPIAGQTISVAALQPDGKVVLGGLQTGGDSGLYLTRLEADGSIDFTFKPPVSTSLVAPKAALILPDGDIVIGGFTVTRSGSSTIVFAVARFTSTGARDTAFGVGGVATFAEPVGASTSEGGAVSGLAAGLGGSVIAVGTAATQTSKGGGGFRLTSAAFGLAQLRAATRGSGNNGDYDGDNISDVAAQLDIGLFGVRTYNLQDTLYSFGATGAGAMIPVSGDFDGDGLADVAGYIVSIGTFAYRPSSGGPDRYLPFGTPGPGGSIPIAGDFDGDGKSDFGVYLPAAGAFALTFSGGTPNALVPFGTAGAGGSIPAIGDYDGDGKADVAVYLPASAEFAILPSASIQYGTPGYKVAFGSAGVGGSIPTPGDYDGDGVTDIAVYLPASGRFAIKPSNPFNAPYYAPFGLLGAGGTIPAPGDYDGDGVTDVAAYLPALGEFAFRRSAGGPDVREGFGLPGAGATVPATSSPSAQAVVFRQSLGRSTPGAGVDLPLTDDLLAELAGLPKRRKS